MGPNLSRPSPQPTRPVNLNSLPCGKAGLRPEWGDVRRDLDRLQQATIESAGKTWTVRTQADGCATALLQATGIALPPRIQATPPPRTGTEPLAPPKRRGRPRRSATRT